MSDKMTLTTTRHWLSIAKRELASLEKAHGSGWRYAHGSGWRYVHPEIRDGLMRGRALQVVASWEMTEMAGARISANIDRLNAAVSYVLDGGENFEIDFAKDE